MANKLYEETSISAIAAAIRQKTGGSDTYTVSQMAQAIQNIPSGGGDYYNMILYMYNNPNPVTILDEFVFPDTITSLGNFNSSYNAGRSTAPMLPVKRFAGAEVTQIGQPLWNYNKYVEELDFPKCTTITSNIAEYASHLKSINFPKLSNMTQGFAFSRCSALTSAYLPELVNCGRGLLVEDTSLTSAYLPKLKKLTGGASGLGNTSLTEICLPSLEAANADMLSGNSLLVNVSFPALKEAIGKSFLNNCPLLENLFLPGDTFVALNVASIFTNSKIAGGTGTIWVNDSLVNTYKAATNWSQFAAVIRPVSEYTGSFDYLNA